MMKKTYRLKFIVFVLLTTLFFCLNGCLFDDDEPENADRGTYTLALSDSMLSTYPGGGDVILCAMTPAGDFSGSVKLSVRSDYGINAVLNRRSLTEDAAVTEIIIYPDSALAPGTYSVTLFHTHDSVSDTVYIPVMLSDFVVPVQLTVAKKMLDEFIGWIQTDYTTLQSVTADKYHVYAISNMAIGGSGIWVAVNEEWEIHFAWGYTCSRFLLRHMGEKEPSHYFIREQFARDQITFRFYEHDVNEYFGLYSHPWLRSEEIVNE